MEEEDDDDEGPSEWRKTPSPTTDPTQDLKIWDDENERD